MFEYLRPTDSLSWTIAWQSSLFLAIGLATTVVFRKRPAGAPRPPRGDARRPDSPPPYRSRPTARLGTLERARSCDGRLEFDPRRFGGLGSVSDPREEASARPPGVALTNPGHPIRPQTGSAAHLQSKPQRLLRPTRSRRLRRRPVPLAVGVPDGLGGRKPGAGARLVVSFSADRGLMVRGRADDDPAIARASRSGGGSARLAGRAGGSASGGGSLPGDLVLGATSRYSCCPKGRGHPTVRSTGTACSAMSWRTGTRRDHLSALAGELLVCILPWNPLAWWSRSRLAELAELACDDWVLASGLPAADYAESLLGLIPAAPVDARDGGRLQPSRPDEPAPPHPRRGPSRSCPRPALDARRLPGDARRRLGPRAGPVPARVGEATMPSRSPAGADRKPIRPGRKPCSGTVLGPDGKPLAGATVLWLASRKPQLSHVALPRGERNANPRSPRPSAKTQLGRRRRVRALGPVRSRRLRSARRHSAASSSSSAPGLV